MSSMFDSVYMGTRCRQADCLLEPTVLALTLEGSLALPHPPRAGVRGAGAVAMSH